MIFRDQRGAGSLWVVLAVVFIILALAAIGFGAWSYVNYLDQKDNVDTKVEAAVATAKKEQADVDEAKFLEREKEPNRTFAGPEDYGLLSFSYPKTWSVYIGNDISRGGDFEAYLNPGSVPPVKRDTQLALRVTIETAEYEDIVDDYSSEVSNGDLKSSTIRINGQTGTRLDGNFTDDIRGSAVIFKIRDKVVTIQTDANTFKNDFDKLIKTITFNK